MSTNLTAGERDTLRDLARQAVAAAARGEAPPPLPPLTGILGEPRGVFVTLTRNGALRGCIGSLAARRPLAEAVRESGRNAAVGDPRFPPVGPNEVDGLDLEVSVLSPLTEIAGPEAIEVGRHGVLLIRGDRQAVFLPQVAREQGWDRDTMLSQLALKAGLPADAWRRGAVFRVFTADVF